LVQHFTAERGKKTISPGLCLLLTLFCLLTRMEDCHAYLPLQCDHPVTWVGLCLPHVCFNRCHCTGDSPTTHISLSAVPWEALLLPSASAFSCFFFERLPLGSLLKSPSCLPTLHLPACHCWLPAWDSLLCLLREAEER